MYLPVLSVFYAFFAGDVSDRPAGALVACFVKLRIVLRVVAEEHCD